jgi:putative chitinase
MNLTREELAAFAPHANAGVLDAFVSPEGREAFARAGINTALRISHFLAQTAAETGGYTIVREHTNWTAEQLCLLWPTRFKTRLDPRILACRGNEVKLANLVYSPRKDLGNVEDDDGWHYRGGGMIQITGRSCYLEAGNALGVDLEGNPELIEDGAISLAAALWFWTRAKLNQFADRNYGRAIGNGINRGNPYSSQEPIGAKSRAQWFDRAWAMFGDGKLPSQDELALGAYGPRVGQLQGRLKELGYGVGSQDKVYGPTLARAVAAFKGDFKRQDADVALEPGEIVGMATWAALEVAEPARVSPERANATAADLIAKDSSIAKGAQQIKMAGAGITAVGGAKAAEESGVLTTMSDLLTPVTLLKHTIAPALDALSWGLRHVSWVVLVVGGVWMYSRGWPMLMARLRDHQTGANLGR